MLFSKSQAQAIPSEHKANHSDRQNEAGIVAARDFCLRRMCKRKGWSYEYFSITSTPEYRSAARYSDVELDPLTSQEKRTWRFGSGGRLPNCIINGSIASATVIKDNEKFVYLLGGNCSKY
ncbi:hypothetical protein HYFRA_00010162 [Hymenoscyphus fraxineus]|uniref:Uncharacterized protein n=1 Tax=Hymenoscyphus fraxineus TaxID=746836 RepID=A0A9N9KVK1_9HELO|nr:hypothetical protein HYFRA_00010162 [Hymenoscyphus fraxineus]